MSQKNISIRIGVVDGDKARKELSLTGEMGERAMRKIKEATAPASKSFTLLNVAAEQVRHGATNLSTGIGSLGSSLSRLGIGGIGAAAGLGAVMLAITSGLKNCKEAEMAFNHLNAALNATGFASGVTAKQIHVLSESVEKTTLFKKEDVQNAAANLTTFGNIQGEIFTKALKLSADLAVRLGTDMPTAAEKLGRALARPADGLGSLEKKFAALTSAQKENIETFIKQGDEMLAQGVIIDHIKSKVNDLAKAQATGLTGSINELSDAWNNLTEAAMKSAHESKGVAAVFKSLAGAATSLRKAVFPTDLEKQTELALKISSGKGTVANKREYTRVSEKIEIDKNKLKEEQKHAHAAAKEAELERRTVQLQELQKKYFKESYDAATSPRQKILDEHALRRKEVEAVSRGGVPDEHKQKALAALNQSTNSKLDVYRKKAIDEINSSLLQTKPSYEASKKALDEWRENLVQNLGGATAKNQEYLSQVNQTYNVKLKEFYNKSILDSANWSAGAQRALMQYSDAATNAATNAEKVFSAAANRAEDVLTNAVMKGKLSFHSLRDYAMSTLEDITRAMIRQSVTGPLVSGITSFLGGFGLFHTGGVVGETQVPYRFMPTMPKDFFSHVPKLHAGLAPDEFPAILQKGETVIPKNASFKGNHGDFNVTFNVTTPNVQSFVESRGQIMANLAGELDRFRMRNR